MFILGSVDGRRIGTVVKTVRQHGDLLQEDVARRARVSQRWVSQVELGRIDGVSLRVLERICQALDIDLRIDARWRGGQLDRLIDRDHAAIVDAVVARLRRHGWDVKLEFGFNHFGDRGSVDVLAFHAATRTLLIIEVKTLLSDLQAMLSSLARKLRIVPEAARQAGWPVERTAYLLVVLGTTTNRRMISGHPSIFATSFSDQTRRVLAWLRSPVGTLKGIWLISPETAGPRAGMRRKRQRVRRRSAGRRQVAT